MGFMEIIRPDGTGYSTKNSDELEFTSFMTCDLCEKLVNAKYGKYIESDGISLIWFCQDCK